MSSFASETSQKPIRQSSRLLAKRIRDTTSTTTSAQLRATTLNQITTTAQVHSPPQARTVTDPIAQLQNYRHFSHSGGSTNSSPTHGRNSPETHQSLAFLRANSHQVLTTSHINVDNANLISEEYRRRELELRQQLERAYSDSIQASRRRNMELEEQYQEERRQLQNERKRLEDENFQREQQ
ncbi:MAG: hypothetical protein FD188_3598, partial [Ignavibacteria bacterium]